VWDRKFFRTKIISSILRSPAGLSLPTDELVPLAEKLLEVPQQLIRTALEFELQGGTVIADQVGETPCVFLAGLYRAERTIAHRLMGLANGTLPWPWIDPDKALPWVEKRIGFALAESQIAAIRLALRSKVLVMTGGPGVGKTTIVKRSSASLQRRAPAFCCVRRLVAPPSE
jgi:exodeoxyribonuclease V alpha subunit